LLFLSVSGEMTATFPNQDSTSATVASLLSQLQASSHFHPSEKPPHASASYLFGPEVSSYAEASHHAAATELSSAPACVDLRFCSFQQALPYIAQLSQDNHIVESVRNMKREQAQLENRLWEERQAIQRTHEERTQIARTKANLIGAGMTQFEADSMTSSFRRELQKFDAERVLPAWDGLLANQQAALESLGMPAMYVTMAAADRQKQQRVLQVLEGAIE